MGMARSFSIGVMKFEREGKGGRWTGIEVVTRIISLCVKLGNE